MVKNETGDTIRCRLPYNCQITPYLHVKAPAGLKIGMLTDNYTGGSANNVRAEYITREGEQSYESFGWMNGHEMLYVIPAGVEVLGLKYRETGYNADIKGTFTCDDAFLPKVLETEVPVYFPVYFLDIDLSANKTKINVLVVLSYRKKCIIFLSSRQEVGYGLCEMYLTGAEAEFRLTGNRKTSAC